MPLGVSTPKWRVPKFASANMVNDMVYALAKVKETVRRNADKDRQIQRICSEYNGACDVEKGSEYKVGLIHDTSYPVINPMA
jgi:hypothetical protein